MKKIFTLLFLGFLSTASFAQLDVHVSLVDNELQVTFPSGQAFEYNVVIMDPIANQTVPLQEGRMGAQSTTTTLRWFTVKGGLYLFSYRYPTATGELSDWYKFDPMNLVDRETK